MPSSEKRVRLGGRTERNRKAVANAVLQLLKDGKINFEIQEVALLSGVNRTTIYRRWPERTALIAEALRGNVSKISVEFSGNWKADLRTIAFTMRDWLVKPMEQGINRLIAATDSREMYDVMLGYWQPIFEEFQQPIMLGKARGEIGKDVDSEIVISTLTSTLLTSVVFLRSYPDDDFVDRLLAQLIRGCHSPRPENASQPDQGFSETPGLPHSD